MRFTSCRWFLAAALLIWPVLARAQTVPSVAPAPTAAALPTPMPVPARPPGTPPPFGKTFAGTPEFVTKAGTKGAGTAALAKFPNNPAIYILTVRHLLGPDGGFATLTPPEQVPAFVSSIRLQYLFTAGSKSFQTTGLKVDIGTETKGALFDAAIFKTDAVFASDAVPVALDRPALGDPVWILAHVRGGVPEGQFVHPAHVIRNKGHWIECQFENPQIVTNGASGAPVLNAAGQLIGVYSGHSEKDGAKIGFLIPTDLFAQIIAAQTPR